jgi:hypothetical protein
LKRALKPALLKERWNRLDGQRRSETLSAFAGIGPSAALRPLESGRRKAGLAAREHNDDQNLSENDAA